MVVPDEDLAGLNAALHSTQEQEVSLSELVTNKGLDGLQWRVGEGQRMDQPNIFANQPRLVGDSILGATKPIDVFFDLWPLTLWQTISVECDRFRLLNGWTQIKSITTQEIICYAGLLIARSLHPWSSGLRNHWRTSTEGPFEPGTFGSYMSRNRYDELGRCLHFADNTKATSDKFYKVNVLVETLNETFKSIYVLGRGIAFDEGTVKALGRRVPAKMFNPMKPHKWGIKLFMTCCAETGFCAKFEVYKGKVDRDGNAALATGPIALYRNMKEYAYTNRVVYCDRFYTSVALFIQLLAIGIYACGTIVPNRKGFCKEIIIQKSDKQERGTLRVATASCGDFGSISAMAWQDTKPVHMLSTGLNTLACVVNRRQKDGTYKDVGCSNAVRLYQQNMGGVDQHDYLRMARYSVQTSHIFKKWYKLFFLAMIDLALVNSYIAWKMKTPSTMTMTHAVFQEQVALGLLNFRVKDDIPGRRRRGSRPSPSTTPVPDGHNHRRHEDGEGYAGRGKRYKRCVVCQKKGLKVMSDYSCDLCGACVCMRANRLDGSFCWLELHQDPEIKTYVEKKQTSKRLRGVKDPSPRQTRRRRRSVPVSNRTKRTLRL